VRAPAALLLVACAPSSTPGHARPAPSPLTAFTLRDLVGTWQWSFQADEAGTSRTESERWRFAPIPSDPDHLAGSYVRDVEVVSTDRVAFACNQRTRYRQRAVFEVVVNRDFSIHETGYHTEPSPCDHGFRHVGDYTVDIGNGRIVLHFDGGTQTLWQTDDRVAKLVDAPWAASYDLAGPWRWQSTTIDTDGNLRDEVEWWELTHRTDSKLDGTYRRRVTVRSPDGKNLPCAHAPQWSFDDAYVVEAEKEEEHWHVHEMAADPADHACLRATPRRNLDEATAEQIGDYVVLEWRGKRRQVVYRPGGTGDE
jgi:hypothetical protein